jgi:hypothetical protein
MDTGYETKTQETHQILIAYLAKISHFKENVTMEEQNLRSEM